MQAANLSLLLFDRLLWPEQPQATRGTDCDRGFFAHGFTLTCLPIYEEAALTDRGTNTYGESRRSRAGGCPDGHLTTLTGNGVANQAEGAPRGCPFLFPVVRTSSLDWFHGVAERRSRGHPFEPPAFSHGPNYGSNRSIPRATVVERPRPLSLRGTQLRRYPPQHLQRPPMVDRGSARRSAYQRR